jgi:4-amino-4-deoxy-L-arabinose transferase-like glycosyltransferase
VLKHKEQRTKNKSKTKDQRPKTFFSAILSEMTDLNGPDREAAAYRVDVVAVGLVAFAARLGWIVFGAWESGDSQWYIATARNLAFNHFFSADSFHPTAYRPPLYSGLIAALWLGSSAPVFTILLVQAALGTLTVMLTYLVARKHGNRAVALAASVGLALAPMTGRFAAVILTETLFTFLVTLGIFFWSRKRYALTGLAFGLGMLTRVTLLPFVLVLLLLTLARPWQKLRRNYLTIALVALAVCSIWMVRNAVVFHRFIPVAASGYGTNLLIGSMELSEADDVAARKASLGRVDSAGGIGSSDETEFDRVRLRAALHRIRERPSSWLKARWQQYPRLFIDSGSYWFGAEGVPFSEAIRQRKMGQVLIRSGMILGNLLVFVLAFIGVVARRSQIVQLTEIILFPLFLALVALPLWIEPRYGLPMMPCVAILSAIGAAEIRRLLRRKFA